MSVGGQATRQNGNNSNAYSGNTSGTTSGTSNSMTTAVAPDAYVQGWNAFTPGPQGFNPTQQTGVNWMTGQLGGIDPNRGAANLNMASDYFRDTLANRTAPTLANLAASGNPAYAAPDPVTAQMISAKTGAEFMDRYKNPYTSDVIDTSLAQFDFDAGKARNALTAGNASAFGNKRYGVAQGEFEAANTLNRAGLGANLRNQSFITGANLGQQDASRVLQADTTNAANALAASTFNSNMANQRQQFDANLGMQYNGQRDNVASTLANLGSSDYALGQGLAGGLVNAGATGQNQNLAWLNAGVPLIGQSNTSSNTGITTGNTSGNSSGTSNGSGSSKGGGFEVGPIRLGG